jgi:platelet-activating factor acetylhydrolase isoform II
MLTRRTLLAATVLTPALSTLPAAARARTTGVPLRLPRPTGPFPVGTTELHLVDHGRPDPYAPGRPRELMASIWYPSSGGGPRSPYLRPLTAGVYAADVSPLLGLEPDAIDWTGARAHAGLDVAAWRFQARRPVVLFSPGFGVPRGLASILVTELASHGYVVVTMDHTYEVSAVEFPGGRLVLHDPVVREDPRLVRATRVADLRFVLDVLAEVVAGGNPSAGPLPAGLARILDLRRIGSYGHSAGGISSADTMHADRRIRAGIDLDGTLGGGYTPDDPAPVVRDGLDRPFLLFGAGRTGPGGNQPQTHLTEPSWGRFWDASTGWKRDLNLPEGMHYSFIDHQVLLPWLERFLDLPQQEVEDAIGTARRPQRVASSVHAYMRAFFDLHLRGKPQRLFDGPSPRHPDVRFID